MQKAKAFLFLFSFFPLLLLAEGGGSEGHGGGSALANLFKTSWKGSLYVLENYPSDARAQAVCSSEVHQWIAYERTRLRGVLESHPPVWIGDADETLFFNKGTLQSECAAISKYNVVLSERRCKPKALQRKDAIQILLIAAFEAEPYFMNASQSRAVAECYAELIDKKMVDYTASTNDAGDLRDELRKIDIGADHSEAERIELLKGSVETAKVHAPGVLRNLSKATIPSSVDAGVLQWAQTANRASNLADDIEKANIVYISGLNPGGSCAWTTSGAMDTVYLSIPICLNNIRSNKDAFETLIHESTHHAPFSVKSELEAEKLAVNLAKIVQANKAGLYLQAEEHRQEILRKAAQIEGMLEDLTGEKSTRPAGVLPTRQELIYTLDRVLSIMKGKISQNRSDLYEVQNLANRIRAQGGVIPANVQSVIEKCEKRIVDCQRYIETLEKLKLEIIEEVF